MIEKNTAEWLSSLLGLLGSLSLAVPFFVDFFAKRKRSRRLAGLKSGAFSAEDAAALSRPVDKNELEKILAAGLDMAGLAVIGCVLLIGSFLVLVFASRGA